MKAFKYPKVDTLPPDAMLVSAYSKMQGYSQPAYVYVKYERDKSKAGFDIVNFQGINFIINRA